MTQTQNKLAATLAERLTARSAAIGIIGMGYVGQPLAIAANRAGFDITGFDVDPAKVTMLNRGEQVLRTVPAAQIKALLDSGRFRSTADMAELAKMDVIVICVPTPLNRTREPDLSYVEATARTIGAHIRPGQLVSLESTTYPGTTRDVVQPLLEAGGVKVGEDIFLAFSPEREDPGNPNFHTSNIPKVVGADDDASRTLASQFYASTVDKIVPVSNAATAESVKLVENIFRSVNIAMVNELKVIFSEMGINVWEVIDAAKTKPFGFMPFYPGPGLGGHCIPIDPFYLSWKAREYGINTRFIELAGEINRDMPRYVVNTLVDALSRRKKKSLNGARILLSGLAYKKNVDDLRESPALALLEMMEAQGAHVDFYDPFIPVVPMTREHAALAGRRSIAWTDIGGYDAILIATDHDDVDHGALVAACDLVVDTRNATARIEAGRERIVPA
ncbi:MAG: nucleotide sugar dehydrogenase [Alphaproteobacteria bacterium]|nr:nucleotide sugar dehydrogenase [Alphaproteobacteria bacterium]